MEYALVTGGTRGTGRETVLALLERGQKGIFFLYREKERRANELVEEAAQLAPDAQVIPLRCDITEEGQLAEAEMLVSMSDISLSGLFLVASGGLEPGMPEDYAMRMNRDAQLAVVRTFWKHLTVGATLVFDTSHWAHLFGKVVQLPAYDPIAETKNAGEEALRQFIRELEVTDPREVRFIVITADMLVDSMVVRGMERRHPGLIAARQELVGIDNPLPKYHTLGVANADALFNPDLKNGDIVIVGGALSTLPRPETVVE